MKTNTKKVKDMSVQVNADTEVYVIPFDKGYSCLGFEVCINRIQRLAKELKLEIPENVKVGTIEAYNYYKHLTNIVLSMNRETGFRSISELTPELIGLEGKRVMVIYPGGGAKEFIVGKSTGWIPCHLEIKDRRSDGGDCVYFPAGSTVKVIN